jgi:hypothetical protein
MLPQVPSDPLLDSDLPSRSTRYFTASLKPAAASRYPGVAVGKRYPLEFLLPGEVTVSPEYRYLVVHPDPSRWVRVHWTDIDIEGLI